MNITLTFQLNYITIYAQTVQTITDYIIFKRQITLKNNKYVLTLYNEKSFENSNFCKVLKYKLHRSYYIIFEFNFKRSYLTKFVKYFYFSANRLHYLIGITTENTL